MTTRPATINFYMYPYASFSETTTLKDSAGVAIDLTGRTALMHIRRNIDDVTPVLTLSTADSTIILGGAAGTIVLALSPLQTSAPTVEWEGESWVHDLILTTTASGFAERTYQGAIFVMPGITRPAP